MKKINSEIKLNLPHLKAKWGTIDKKHPSSIYLELGTYITPKNEDDDYQSLIKNIEKGSKEIIKKAAVSTNEVKNNFIFVSDVADTRISYGKQSYINFQIHMGTNMPDSDFKSMVNFMNDKWSNVYTSIYENIEENGFECSKTKN